MSLSRVPIAPHRVSRLGAARLGAARASRGLETGDSDVVVHVVVSSARARVAAAARDGIDGRGDRDGDDVDDDDERRRARARGERNADNAFVARLVEKSANARETRAKERLDRYNEKNFGEYLKWEAGGRRLEIRARSRRTTRRSRRIWSRWVGEEPNRTKQKMNVRTCTLRES